MAERTSWLAIETGWEVQDRSGASIGEVTAVVGDPAKDIFDGLRLETSDGSKRYVPGERVGEILEGQVSVDAELVELAESPAAEEPQGAELQRDRDAEL
jgi:hypothetical protein